MYIPGTNIALDAPGPFLSSPIRLPLRASPRSEVAAMKIAFDSLYSITRVSPTIS